MAYVKSTDWELIQKDVLLDNISGNTKISKLKKFKTAAQNVQAAINELFAVCSVASVSANEADNRSIRVEQALEALNITLDKIQEQLKFAADDYEDKFIVPENETRTAFTLTHIPIGKIRMYVGGTRQFSDMFSYDSQTNTVTWTATAANNGFDLEDTEVVFEYDYDPEENNIQSP